MGELDLTKLPIGTRLKTRDGASARLLATDLAGDEPCAVAIMWKDWETPYAYEPGGRFYGSGSTDENDIVSVETEG